MHSLFVADLYGKIKARTAIYWLLTNPGAILKARGIIPRTISINQACE
ncbi:hypothetical protein [Cronobacter malonaticus]|nr:hypothetical protein [Cronobacter malonaticus]ELY4818109.1 hypothetical protein [Cronobacter malonaticus]ELY5855359.1 hypothetical protein [Cronobacter malonaticus]WRU13985.1 hypothetical protein U9L39_17500 [Cronobacter malonaticus]